MIKRYLISVFTLLLSIGVSAADSLTVIYRIRLDQDIDKSSQRLVTLGLEKASEASADYVLLDLDTYGGAVDAADSIRSAILRYEGPVVAFINMCKYLANKREVEQIANNCYQISAKLRKGRNMLAAMASREVKTEALLKEYLEQPNLTIEEIEVKREEFKVIYEK